MGHDSSQIVTDSDKLGEEQQLHVETSPSPTLPIIPLSHNWLDKIILMEEH